MTKGTHPGAGSYPAHRGCEPLRSQLFMCQYIDGYGETIDWRHWTAVEDAAIRLSAQRGHPTLRALAGDCGRTYIRYPHPCISARGDSAHSAGPGTAGGSGTVQKIPCRYCGEAFLPRGGARYCGGECSTLSTRHCPGCGRSLGKGLRCSRCAVEGKRADWPERSKAAL